MRVVRQVDEQPPGDRYLRREPAPFEPIGSFHHLREDGLALGEDLLDRPVAAVPDVGDVQERGALQADLDERRLHPGQHARHAPDVDVAHQPAARRPLDQELLHHARRGDRPASPAA